jgi:hypothetical protein
MLCMGWADVNPHLYTVLQQVLVSYHVAGMAGTLVLSLRINSKVLLDGNWKVLVSLQGC